VIGCGITSHSRGYRPPGPRQRAETGRREHQLALGVALACDGKRRSPASGSELPSIPRTYPSLRGCQAGLCIAAEAEINLLEAVELNPDDPAVRFGLERAVFDLDRPDDAENTSSWRSNPTRTAASGSLRRRSHADRQANFRSKGSEDSGWMPRWI